MEVLDWFNPVAKTAALWTLNELAPENLEYVRQLPKGPLAVDGMQLMRHFWDAVAELQPDDREYDEGRRSVYSASAQM